MTIIFRIQDANKEKKVWTGQIAMNQESLSILDETGKGELLHLVRPRVDWIAAHNMKVSGMEEIGSTPSGQLQYRYREFYIFPVSLRK